MTDLKRLFAPFSPVSVSWRIGSTNQDKTKGMALAYIDARDVMERLDEVCGPGGWQCRYSHTATKTVCDIAIKIDGEWVWKADGAGDSDVEAEKGALSDAFKRAAVKWGIGRYLYALPSPWVQIVQKGRSYIIPDHEKARLADLLAKMRPNEHPWVTEARADGNMDNAPEIKPEVLERARARVNNAIEAFRMAGHTKETLMAFWADNKKTFDAIYKHVPAEHERLVAAYDEALNAAPKAAA